MPRLDVRDMVGLRRPPRAEAPATEPPAESALPEQSERRGRHWRNGLAAGIVAVAGLTVPWTIGPDPLPPPLPPSPPFKGDPTPPPASAPLQAAAADAAELRDFAHAQLPPAVVLPPLLPSLAMPVPPEQQPWRRNAAAAEPQGRPMIAIVIDDLGLDRRNADRVAQLPGPLTLAFMTYADDLPAQTRAARAAGHELLVHVPMEPMDGALDAGRNVLRPELPPGELLRRVDWALSRFDGYVGINNHMGSRFTADAGAMALLLGELHRRGLLFLDSRTTPATVGGAVAARYGVPFASRTVFLDNDSAAGAVWFQLMRAEADARRTGAAVAIGHPHDGTIAALAQWLPTLKQRGFALVPVSRIVERDLAAKSRTVSYRAAGPGGELGPAGSSYP